MGALLSILVDEAEKVGGKKNKIFSFPSFHLKQLLTPWPSHLQLSPFRYESRSFLSGLLTTGMFSVCSRRNRREMVKN